MPARYLKFFAADEPKRHAKAQLGGLPGYQASASFRLGFVRPGSLALFEENDVDETNAALVPFAELVDEAQFLVIDLSQKTCPVLMWEHETGAFVPLEPSLDAFVRRLSARAKLKAPSLKQLFTVMKKAQALHDAGKTDKASALLEPALADFPPESAFSEDDPYRNTPPAAFELLGRLLSARKDVAGAVAAFDEAIVRSGTFGPRMTLNLLEVLLQHGRFDDVVKRATPLLGADFVYEYETLWLHRYLVRATLATGSKDALGHARALAACTAKDRATRKEVHDELAAFATERGLTAAPLLAVLAKGSKEPAASARVTKENA